MRSVNRFYLAVPGHGLLAETWHYADAVKLLSDRKANKTAYPGELIVRIPRRIARADRGLWPLKDYLAGRRSQ